MKQFTFILIAMLLTFTFGSCQKVIDLDIDDSEKKVVIEAELKEGTNQFEVIISESSYYNDLYSSFPLENASITLSDDQGFSIQIQHAGSGIYSETITAVAGNTYTLSVEINGITYVASSFLKNSIQLDGLTTEYLTTSFFSDEPGTRVNYQFTDPLAAQNFYRVRYFVDNQLMNTPTDLNYFNDELFNGQVVSRPASRNLFDAGQTVKIELIHIDESTYNYLYTLGDIIGASYSASAAPSNPISNWSNGAMGVFSAYNIDSMSVVIP